MAALGTAALQLRYHIGGARNGGGSPEEVVETIQQMAVFAGFPAALNGIGIARRIFAERA